MLVWKSALRRSTHSRISRKAKTTDKFILAGDAIFLQPGLLCPFSVSQILRDFFHFSYWLLFAGLQSHEVCQHKHTYLQALFTWCTRLLISFYSSIVEMILLFVSLVSEPEKLLKIIPPQVPSRITIRITIRNTNPTILYILRERWFLNANCSFILESCSTSSLLPFSTCISVPNSCLMSTSKISEIFCTISASGTVSPVSLN